jgi:hypothetical protein
VRRGRRDRDDDGEVVVRAVVHARLLGLHILSLDARVVVGRPPDRFTALDPEVSVRARPEPLPSSAPRGPRPVHRDGSASALSRAVELLADGEETLERSRRLAHRARSISAG